MTVGQQVLRVAPADRDDVYRDIVRVSELYRVDSKGRTVPEGSVCRISIGARSAFGLVRGVSGLGHGTAEPVVHIDERLRNALGVAVGDDVQLGFSKTWLAELRWAWGSSDPAYRAMARLAVLSVELGIVGLALGLVALAKGP